MSRYKIGSSQHLIYLGWDKPLRTFFAVIENPYSSDDSSNYILLWVGTSYDEIMSIAQLAQFITDYCSIPYEVVIKLENDFRENFEPTHTQLLAKYLLTEYKGELNL